MMTSLEYAFTLNWLLPCGRRDDSGSGCFAGDAGQYSPRGPGGRLAAPTGPLVRR